MATDEYSQQGRGARRRYTWQTIAENFAKLPYKIEWIDEATATQTTGFTAQSLMNFAAEDGTVAEVVQKQRGARRFRTAWLYFKMTELYGVGWRDIRYDDEDALARVRAMLAQWWSEPQQALGDIAPPPRPIYREQLKQNYSLTNDPEQQRGKRRREITPPLQRLTCPTCGETYEGHPGASTECRRCRSRTALLRKHAERRAARDALPPDQPPTP